MFFLSRLAILAFTVVFFNLCFAAEVPKNASEFGSSSKNNPFHQKGWVPRELIPKEFIDDLVPAVCQGTYLPVYSEFGVEGELNIAADTVESNDTLYTTLSGNVEGTTKMIRFFANKAIVNQQLQLIELYGNIIFYLHDIVLQGNEAFYNAQTGELMIDKVQYARGITRTRFQTNLLARDQQGVFHLSDASYSTCEPDRNDWRVYGKKIDLNYIDGWGTITHAVIYVSDIPVFYFPWFRFPLDDRRHTGLLVPTFTTDSRNGLTITQPIYLNLAPHYDATITPTYYATRGQHVDFETRLLTSYGQNALYYGYIDDRILKSSRSLTGFQHEGGENLPWSTRVSYTSVSDTAYFKDLDKSFVSISSKLLDQYGEINIARGGVRTSFGWYDFQPVNFYSGTSYARLPGIKGSYTNRWKHFGLKTDGEYDEFQPRRLAPFSASEKTAGDAFVTIRRHATITPGLYLRAPYGSIEAFTLINFSDYSLHMKGDRKPNIYRQLNSAVLNGKLIFEREAGLDTSSFSQTLELKAQYLETIYQKQDDIPNFTTSEPKFNYSSIFALDRFKGVDKFGDTKQLSYGISTEVFNSNADNIFRFQLGQIYYFGKPREVTLSANNTSLRESIGYTRDFSPLASRTTLSLPHNIRVVNDLVWDQRISKSLVNSLTIQKTLGPRSFFTIGYNLSANQTQVDDDLTVDSEQLSGGGAIQLTPPLAVFGRTFYDIKKEETIERLLGLEYESCCWRVTIGQFQRTNFLEDGFPTETGAFIQFHLKGLGSVSSRGGKAKIGDIKSVLEKAIPGYTSRTLYLAD